MEEFFTVNQSAIYMKVHPLTIRRYIKQGKLKAYRAGGNLRIALEDIRQFMTTAQSSPNRIARTSPISSETKTFSNTDSFLRLKGRGLSMSKLE
jgi:excisionase family DNA binding protein